MRIVTVAQMRALERAAIAAGASEARLMDEAGRGVARCLMHEFPDARRFAFFCGKGNNGGDGLVAARALWEAGRVARCFSPFSPGDDRVEPMSRCASPALEGAVLVDALLGIGASGPLRGEIADVAKSIFGSPSGPVVALDVPTGVDADTGEVSEGAVRADLTVTCGLPKAGMFRGRAVDYVGRVRVVPLPIPSAAVAALGEVPEFFCEAEARGLLPRRAWSAHKGHGGHVVVVAGAVGTSGAAVMAIEGALHAGAGLVTAFVPEAVQPIVAGGVMEAMVRPFRRASDALTGAPEGAVIVVGPGLGRGDDVAALLRELVRDGGRRVVLDADAINMLAQDKPLLSRLGDGVLLTPHPGEMRRLTGADVMDRAAACEGFVAGCRAALLLKGASSIACQAGRPLSYNASGNPGMATGGMGDVLAGICGGLMAQGLGAYDAARLGAFLHGLACDLALVEESFESLLPRHLLAKMGRAFRVLRIREDNGNRRLAHRADRSQNL